MHSLAFGCQNSDYSWAAHAHGGLNGPTKSSQNEVKNCTIHDVSKRQGKKPDQTRLFFFLKFSQNAFGWLLTAI